MEYNGWDELLEDSPLIGWKSAPKEAICYSEGYFRNNRGDWWDESSESWKEGGYSQEELVQAIDFEHRPDEFKDNEYYQLQNIDPVSTTEATQEATPYVEKSQWTAAHYDNYYQLTPKDIEAGKVKIDAYFVNKMWKLNQKDDTGGLFHSLKTIARFGEKNPIERELKALYNQTKRMAELYGVDLE